MIKFSVEGTETENLLTDFMKFELSRIDLPGAINKVPFSAKKLHFSSYFTRGDPND